jgi:uncharacterized protein YkwD
LIVPGEKSTSTLTSTRTDKEYIYEELVQLMLEQINYDRAMNGVQTVNLSGAISAQWHAEDMLRNDYYSHWDTGGMKPYVRYKVLGGKGAVFENIGLAVGELKNGGDVWNAILQIHRQMMYNDAHVDWRHRENILDPYHNKVNIGIAWNSNEVYLVQHFENDYIDLILSPVFRIINTNLEMTASMNLNISNIYSVSIHYDPYPQNISSSKLRSEEPYNLSYYDYGEYLGSILPSGYEAVDGITVRPSEWIVNDQWFLIRSDLTDFFNLRGKGIYTMSLWLEIYNEGLILVYDFPVFYTA